MARQIRVRSIKRKQIDEDKLALAFLMLAKILDEQKSDADSAGQKADSGGEREAA